MQDISTVNSNHVDDIAIQAISKINNAKEGWLLASPNPFMGSTMRLRVTFRNGKLVYAEIIIPSLIFTMLTAQRPSSVRNSSRPRDYHISISTVRDLNATEVAIPSLCSEISHKTHYRRGRHLKTSSTWLTGGLSKIPRMVPSPCGPSKCTLSSLTFESSQVTVTF